MPGIVGCLRKVLDARNIRDHGDLSRFVGPPVEEWTRELLPDAPQQDRLELARDYRACYDREGWRNNSVFPGVRDMLTQLHQAGFTLFVCTSKQQHFAARILDLFELSGVFAAIYGDKAEFPNHEKTELLGLLLREQGLNPSDAWMIGDRIFDIQAARANQVRSLAAGWGYGDSAEHARAHATAATPSDVLALVQPVAGLTR